MRFRLRTLMILLAALPPIIAWWGWPTMQRILWPPKPEWQFNSTIPAMGPTPLAFDFAFPIPAQPPAATAAPLPPDDDQN